MIRPTFLLFGLSAMAATLAGCDDPAKPGDGKQAAAAPRTCPAIDDTPVRLPGGTFAMGEEDVYAEEGPVRETTVAGFWIDPHEVTNRQFAAFVEATGHVTVAENPSIPNSFSCPPTGFRPIC